MSSEGRVGWAALVMGGLGVGVVYLWPGQRWIGWAFVCASIIAALIWAYSEIEPLAEKNKIFRRIGAFGLIGMVLIAMVTLTWPRHKINPQIAPRLPSASEIVDELAKRLPPKKSTESPTKPESPKNENPPATKKESPPAKLSEKTEAPAFAVAVETKMLVPSPSKDIAGTGLWGVNRVGPNCYMWSADTAMFIRIRNLQSVRVMITAYNVYGIGGELRRIRLDLNEPFRFVQRGRIPLPMNMPPGSGNMNGGFFQVQFQDTDFSRGYPVQAEFLDRQIGERYIEPNGIVRGWAFFEYPSITAMPARLTIKVNDDLGHVFSYPVPDEAGNQSGDTLPRIITYGTPIDLSSCARQPHPAPLQ